MTQTTTTAQAQVSQMTPELKAALEKIAAIRKELRARFIEREPLVDLLLMAAISRQHLLILGTPGEGKSAIMEAFTARIEGAKYFETQLGEFSTPEELFGVTDVNQMLAGHYRTIGDEYLQHADIVGLDEVYKCNPSLLRGRLLRPLNERKSLDDGKWVPIPMQFAVLTSNELPEEGDQLEAFADRILYSIQVDTLSDAGHKQFIHDELGRRRARAQGKDTSGKGGTTITKEELALLQQAALDVFVPTKVQEAWFTIRTKVNAAGYGKASTRRAGWIWDAVCAHAIMYGARRGQLIATPDDLTVLQHVLWKRPEDAAPIARIVLEESNKLVFEAHQAEDQAQELLDECVSKVRVLTTEIENLKANAGNIQQKAAAAQQVTQKEAEKQGEIERAHVGLQTLEKKLLRLQNEAKGAGVEYGDIVRIGKEVQAKMLQVAALRPTIDSLATFDESAIQSDLV